MQHLGPIAVEGSRRVVNVESQSHAPSVALVADPATGRRRGRAEQVAEVVAGHLRRRILDGQLDDGDPLPKLEDLVLEFGASRPTIRDALRILETEGLATVRRGRFGGAIVHRPQVVTAAHALGIVLQVNDVDVDDLTLAIRRLEPICVELCAARSDRAATILPALRRLHEEARASLDDARRFSILSTRFHEHLVEGSGNATLRIVIGALQVLWTAHAAAWADTQHISQDEFPTEDYRRRSLEEHELILRLIEAGDGQSAARLARRHLDWTTEYVTHAVDRADA